MPVPELDLLSIEKDDDNRAHIFAKIMARFEVLIGDIFTRIEDAFTLENYTIQLIDCLETGLTFCSNTTIPCVNIQPYYTNNLDTFGDILLLERLYSGYEIALRINVDTFNNNEVEDILRQATTQAFNILSNSFQAQSAVVQLETRPLRNARQYIDGNTDINRYISTYVVYRAVTVLPYG